MCVVGRWGDEGECEMRNGRLDCAPSISTTVATIPPTAPILTMLPS